MIFPTLSIKQPWTLAIMRLGKDVENRTWKTEYRGPMALHASATWAAEADGSTVLRSAWRRFTEQLAADGAAADQTGPLDKASPWVTLGAVVAVARLDGICGRQLYEGCCDCGDWAMPDQYHWRFVDVRPLRKPVPCRGALKVWGLPKGVNDAVQAQL